MAHLRPLASKRKKQRNKVQAVACTFMGEFFASEPLPHCRTLW